MIKYIRRIWSKPAIMIEENPWIVGFYYGLAVYLVLALFQPFGISSDATSFKYVYLLGYLLISLFGVALPYYILSLIFSDFSNEDAWTNGRSLISTMLTIVLISVGNMLYPVIFGWTSFSCKLAWLCFTQTLLIFVAVYGIKLWLNNKVLKKNLENAINLNAHINSARNDIYREEKSRTKSFNISLSGIGKNATVDIELENLLYIESDKNYCKIVYLQNEQCNERMIRCTISSLEEQLSLFPFAIRCHRAFIVNVKCICSVEGNSSGYRLLLNGTDIRIPVSRSYTSSILAKIEAEV